MTTHNAPSEPERERPSAIAQPDPTPPDTSMARRTALGLIGLGSLGLLGTQPALARGPPSTTGAQWRHDVDANGHSLLDLGSLTMADDSTAITDLAGRNLAVDASGVLNATDTRTNVSDGGSPVVTDAVDIDFGSNLSVADDGDGSVTVSASAPASPWADTDGDGLLETSARGIQVDAVETASLAVSNVGFTVGLSAAQTLAAGDARVVVAFDDVDFDDRDEFDPATHQFVASAAGTYQVDVYLTIGAGTTASTLGVSVERFYETTSGQIPGPDLAELSMRKQSVTALSLSRLLRLPEGTILKVVADNIATSSDRTIFPGAQSVWSIHRVG